MNKTRKPYTTNPNNYIIGNGIPDAPVCIIKQARYRLPELYSDALALKYGFGVYDPISEKEIAEIYSEENNKIYFHGAKEGHKIDAIKNYDKASFCVYDSGYRKDGEWALNINSVIVFGKIRLVTDPELTRKICTKLVQKFTDDEEYLEKELKNALPRVQCLELEIEHMTGKLVNES